MENLKGKYCLEDLAVDRWIIVKWVLKKLVVSVEWIELAQDMGHWWALVNTIMHHQVSQKSGDFLAN